MIVLIADPILSKLGPVRSSPIWSHPFGSVWTGPLLNTSRKLCKSRFPIAVLLTTLICSHLTTTKFTSFVPLFSKIYLYFSFCELLNQMSWGVWYTVGKVFWRHFQQHITSPKLPKVSAGKWRKKNLQLISDCRAGWSKEPQWENDYGSFLHSFLLVKVMVSCFVPILSCTHGNPIVPKIRNYENHLPKPSMMLCGRTNQCYVEFLCVRHLYLNELRLHNPPNAGHPRNTHLHKWKQWESFKPEPWFTEYMKVKKAEADRSKKLVQGPAHPPLRAPTHQVQQSKKPSAQRT